jgi:hypothetical protein
VRRSAIVLSILLLTGVAPLSAPGQARQTAADSGFELGARLGVDDGYALVIETSGDIQGDLGPCG